MPAQRRPPRGKSVIMAAMNVATVFAARAREVTQDDKQGLRLWARRPWHTGFAILALAIGIGANTGVFSVVNALLLRALPFQSPDRLAALRESWWLPHGSAAEFHDWRQKSVYLGDVALVEQKDVNLGGLGESSYRAHASQCSWNFFSLLGTQTVVGRGFAAGEDTLWTERGRGDRLWTLAATIRRRTASAGFNDPHGRSACSLSLASLRPASIIQGTPWSGKPRPFLPGITVGTPSPGLEQE